jgi:hypothetical protein
MKQLLISIVFYLIFYQQLFAQAVYWQQILNQHVFDVEVTSNEYLFTCPQYLRGVLVSTDKGLSWTPDISIDKYIENIAVDKNDNIYLGSRYGSPSIFKSSDYGNSWAIICYLGFDVTALHVSNEGYIYAGGVNGGFLRSIDSGQTWSSSSISNKKILSIATTSDQRIFVCTEYGSMFTSLDLGITWIELPNPPNTYSAEYVIIDSNDNLYTARRTKIGISTDFGITWIISGNFPTATTTSILGKDSSNIYYGFNSIYKSSDGVNWDYMGGPNKVYKITSSNNIIYLATTAGIYKYDPAVVIHNQNDFVPLQVGNEWQFLTSSYFSSGVTNPRKSFGISSMKVSSDTIVLGEKYYLVENRYYRFSDDLKLYELTSTGEVLLIDFSLSAGTTFNYFGINAHMVEDVEFIFNYPRLYKGFYYNSLSSGYTRKTFLSSIGWASYYNRYQRYGSESESQELIHEAIVHKNDTIIHYKNNYVATGSVNSISINSDQTISISMNAYHEVNKSGSGGGSSRYYISSVSIQYFYSNGIDSTEIFTRDLQNQNNTNVFNESILIIDTLTNDFKLYYKFSMKDKGLIQNQFSYPSQGYLIFPLNPLDMKMNENSSYIFNLSQNYPNPFNPSTKIKYAVRSNQKVVLKIYDVLGKEVAVLVNEEKPAGEYEVEFSVGSFGDGSKLSSGVYFYQLKAGSFIQTNKMILMR